MYIKNNKSRFKDQLICEAQGLQLLRKFCNNNSSSSHHLPLLSIPEVFLVNETELHLQNINCQALSEQQFAQLGEGLALLHQQGQQQYGFENDNYIGLNPQKNGFTDNWGNFFVEHRLLFQANMIERPGTQHSFVATLKKHQHKLENYLNENCAYPSPVHGDLWSGNVLADTEKVWLIDPAFYYADREVDLAMTEMFGGFSPTFYSVYDKFLPRSDAYSQKKVIYNLYHYLNHYNLFGSAYLDACGHALALIEDL